MCLWKQFKLPFRLKSKVVTPNFATKSINQFKVMNTLGPEIFYGLSNSYSNILQAIADADLEYLENVVERRLYNMFESSLNNIESDSLKLKYIGQEEPQEGQVGINIENFMQRLNSETMRKKFGGIPDFLKIIPCYREDDMTVLVVAGAVWGVNIDRNSNKGIKVKPFFFPNTNRNYFFHTSNFFSTFKKEIISLDTIFYTNRRVLLVDEDEEIIEGDDNLDHYEIHSMRFESYTDELNWVLTDVDDFMKGNPYL